MQAKGAALNMCSTAESRLNIVIPARFWPESRVFGLLATGFLLKARRNDEVREMRPSPHFSPGGVENC
jgi:hypothetical protein